MSNLPATPSSVPALAELLPDPLDPILTRPLALHHGRAYAAVWPRLRRSLHHDDPAAPDVPPSRAPVTLLLVRDDGLLSQPVSPADTLVRLAALPPLPADRLWSTSGLQAYCLGRRPDPAQVFHALTAVFDRFMDFTDSLGPQAAVTELLATYVLATWFLPAFTHFSHLWLLGDHGSGKTRLLHLLARLTHLGAVVPVFAPTAPLRDLAALGASLAVDNADGLYTSLTNGLAFRPAAATLRQGLFLAGARRDVLFPLHQRLTGPSELAAYGLTHLDVFGPRLFAAQQPPHPAVAARALYLPLLRSTDRARCLADPADPDSAATAWPVSPRALTDDLWALALAHLAELPAHVAATAAEAPLVGAGFQTWHPLFAVAAWLTAHGIPGLLDRLRALARAYPERVENLGPQAADPTILTVKAIYAFVAMQAEKCITSYQDNPRGTQGRRATQGTPADNSPQQGRRATQGAPADNSPQQGRRATQGTPTDNSPQQGRRATQGTPADNSGRPEAAPPLDPVIVAYLNQLHFRFTPAMLLSVMHNQAQDRTWDELAAGLSPTVIGRVLVNLGLVQKKSNGHRLYRITLPQLDRLIDAYRVPLPSVLVSYRSFREETIRANAPRPANDPPLAPPSPAVLAAAGPLLREIFHLAPPARPSHPPHPRPTKRRPQHRPKRRTQRPAAT